MIVYTIGHSTRPIDEFIEILQAHHIEALQDVRTVPGSRRNPQFGAAALAASLKDANIGYVPRKDLGGLRRPRPDSPNSAWRNDSFRGYADYMQTDAFADAVELLMKDAAGLRTVIMCAEAVPWRCHRSLIADALTIRGVEVQHIMSESRAQPHTLTSFAFVEGNRLTYPGRPGQLTLDKSNERIDP